MRVCTECGQEKPDDAEYIEKHREQHELVEPASQNATLSNLLILKG